MRSFRICSARKKYWGDKFKELVVGRACSKHERISYKIWVGKPGEGGLRRLRLG
jgi:hypothetical protein